MAPRSGVQEGWADFRGEIELADGDAPYDVDQQAAFDGFDAVVQGCLVIVPQDGDALLGEDRAGIDAIVDDDDARAGLRDSCGECVAHAMSSGELREIGRVGVHDPGRPFVHQGRGQQSHEAAQHHEVRLPHGELGTELGAPLLAGVELHPRDHERRDAVVLGMRETLGFAIGADDDHAGGVVGIGRCIQEGP